MRHTPHGLLPAVASPRYIRAHVAGRIMGHLGARIMTLAGFAISAMTRNSCPAISEGAAMIVDGDDRRHHRVECGVRRGLNDDVRAGRPAANELTYRL